MFFIFGPYDLTLAEISTGALIGNNQKLNCHINIYITTILSKFVYESEYGNTF